MPRTENSRTTSFPRRTAPVTYATATVATLLATLLTPAAAAQAAAGPKESRPVHSYARAVRESVWVDTGLDSDLDGRNDRVAADIVRPREPARQGRKVPVIMEASPYYACCGRGNESQKKTYDKRGHVDRMPLFYDNYFVPRGYAFVGVDLAGTNRSDGCVDVGGRNDIRSAKAVIDWLNGRARAYTSRRGGTAVEASWTNGRTGMIGKSWDGTIANGVAATGVEGLKTIVPIGAISSWYDYYFAKGAPFSAFGPDWLSFAVQSNDASRHCAATDRKLIDGAPRSGDWTPLWSERDYIKDAAKIRASVFLVHGMQDLNVRSKHVGQWWDALAKHGVERKIWLSQTGHVDPFDFRRADWVRTLHRWFDHELLGYDNGIDREPMADIERHPDRWATSKLWPPRATHTATLHPATGSRPGVGTLGPTPGTGTGTGTGTETFTDDRARGENDWAARIGGTTPEKAGFVTEPLTRDLRLAGSSKVTVTATPTTSTAHLSAVLVDLGPATVRDYTHKAEGITTLTNRTCWGSGTKRDSACFKATRAKKRSVGHTVFSRGWADLGNHASDRKGVPLTPGRACTITLDLAATDHVVPEGHRLALILAGTDKGLIEPPSSTPTLTLDLARTSVHVPLVGGAAAFARATRAARGGASAAGSPSDRD
ncbi:Xaa-Pro dipeptidyl-peptidase [Streptomyces sp. LBUM 1478]|uniref:Xaa-Pro dipeptidyl-peptidase n=1 Tax=Streptomyces scabiei TaxID=1930 RepID=UPI00077398E2|nr:Xaa-Pro dipeptidyl-peptidase [Streptomyces scabiei]MBP5908697.1 Xaa-Pro dipeptidyl-peptidase [Streptomyces sp. LBUM 1478]MBP5927758.1 Xaa-Pro dipeptidyl-peptidase [Streptomyces sp. LBUM 1479]MDX2532165.1 Xaa-Pro dipeptidyl-peptidase [Streptomyces scabiei]MDX2794471.1 Xaa-Pro dipeptidyl-peptidase [Streptomyces scabiei]MDX2859821.1 Xaa-Pro dipeptidyl-peptidase [Streptomyces scabiei]